MRAIWREGRCVSWRIRGKCGAQDGERDHDADRRHSSLSRSFFHSLSFIPSRVVWYEFMIMSFQRMDCKITTVCEIDVRPSVSFCFLDFTSVKKLRLTSAIQDLKCEKCNRTISFLPCQQKV